MIIRCPSCLLEKTVPDDTLAPGKRYKVTCPRCKNVFRFPEEKRASGNAPTSDENSDSSSEHTENRNSPASQGRSDSLSDRHNGNVESPNSAGNHDFSPNYHNGSAANDGQNDNLSADAEKTAQDERKTSSQQDEGVNAERRVSSDSLHNAAEQFQEENDKTQANTSSQDDSQQKKKSKLKNSGEADNLPPGATIPDFPSQENEDWGKDPQDENDNAQPQGAPWEYPQFYGIPACFTRTVIAVLFHPRAFFENVRSKRPPVYPLGFYVLLSLVQVLMSRLWSIKALKELMEATTDPQQQAQLQALSDTFSNGMNIPLLLLFTPFFSIFQALLIAGLLYFMIRMVQPDRADFSTTLRVICYSAAPLVLCVVPLYGSNIASLCFAVYVFLGCKYALRLPWHRTLLAIAPIYILAIALLLQVSIFLKGI